MDYTPIQTRVLTLFPKYGDEIRGSLLGNKYREKYGQRIEIKLSTLLNPLIAKGIINTSGKGHRLSYSLKCMSKKINIFALIPNDISYNVCKYFEKKDINNLRISCKNAFQKTNPLFYAKISLLKLMFIYQKKKNILFLKNLLKNSSNVEKKIFSRSVFRDSRKFAPKVDILCRCNNEVNCQCSCFDYQILTILSQFENIVCLDLSGQKIRNSITGVMLERLTRNSPYLKSLNLQGCNNITNASMIRCIPKCTELRYINFTDCENSITNRVVELISKHCLFLEIAYFKRCYQLTSSSVKNLIYFCKKLKNISFDSIYGLTDDIFQYLEEKTQLENVNVRNCYRLTDKGISNLILKSPFLKKINLAKCLKVTDISIMNALENCDYLTHLNMNKMKSLSSSLMSIFHNQLFNYMNNGYTYNQHLVDERFLKFRYVKFPNDNVYKKPY
tara:strand:+ start:147 stop:1481 length:1335 start_codon:yes stop_codon:yes gene_type:complete